MVCYHPMTAYWAQDKWPSGKRKITFSKSNALEGTPLKLACGQCSGCRLEKSRQWAVRMMHEASLYDENCFITLTYDDDNLPYMGTLVPRDFTLFLKRLRKRFGSGIRYYMCGEYGDEYGRPHYHACLFNFRFPERIEWKRSGEHMLYMSPALDALWGKGLSCESDFTFETAAYTARYLMKKVNGDAKEDHYSRVDGDGVIHNIVPEFARMSRRPGIGADWYKSFCADVHNGDFVLYQGRKGRVPTFYDRELDKINPDKLVRLKRVRKVRARKHKLNNTVDRLRVREVCQLTRLKRLNKGRSL